MAEVEKKKKFDYGKYFAEGNNLHSLQVAPDDREWLFDLVMDPQEIRNLARNPMHGERLAAMRAGLIARFQQDGYTLVARMARYAVTPQLQLQANVDNLFDKKFYSNMGSFSQYRYGAPRNFTIGATYRF